MKYICTYSYYLSLLTPPKKVVSEIIQKLMATTIKRTYIFKVNNNLLFEVNNNVIIYQ